MSDKKFRMKPEICTYTTEDDSKLNLEVTIPGVNKDDIRLQMMDTSFSLSAPAKDVEYVSATAFCCPVNAKEAKAVFENGCLKIEVPFKDPNTESVQVAVQ